MPRSRRRRPVDAIGAGLATSFGIWILVSAAVNRGSRPLPTLLGLIAAALTFAGGRAARRAIARDPIAPSVALAVVGGAAVAFAALLDVGSAGGGPLGYGNANSALFGILGFAAAIVRVTATAPTRRMREAAAALVVGCAVACVLTGSAGAVSAAGAAAGLAGGAALARARWVAVGLAATVLAGVTGVVFALALGAGPEVPGSDSYGTRVQLWREAAALVEDHRATGVGPGRFQAETTVSPDEDLRRAHSAPLQAAAELGIPGLVLYLAVGGWVLAALWAVRDEVGGVVGTAAVAALGLQSAFDWVLSEPTVLLVTAAVAGAATTSSAPPLTRLPRRLPRSPGSRLPRR